MSTATQTRFDVQAIRSQFPILERRVHGKPLVYLDSAATTQKPRAVIDALADYYRRSNANVHRGVHTLSQEATDLYEGARDWIRRWINAADAAEIIYTRGTTEAINLVANAWGRTNLRAGDEIVLSQMEHHSNIVPWQLVAAATGAVIRVAPVSDEGEIDLDGFRRLLGPRTRIVSIVHVSNALGTINPLEPIVELAHDAGAIVVVDGAQALQHMRVDVRAIGCDFYALSGHKMFAPMGAGALYGRRALLEAMPPWQGGGDMIKSVSFERTLYNDLPHKFEAGTPDVAAVVGLGAAIEWLGSLDPEALAAHERDLLEYATARIASVPGVRLIGTAAHKAPSVSFLLGEVHPHDVGTVLDTLGIAIRTGHHCTQPLMNRFGVAATARASFCLHSTRAEVDALVEGLGEVRRVFRS